MVSFGEKAKIKKGGKFELRSQLCYYNCMTNKDKLGDKNTIRQSNKNPNKGTPFEIGLMNQKHSQKLLRTFFDFNEEETKQREQTILI